MVSTMILAPGQARVLERAGTEGQEESPHQPVGPIGLVAEKTVVPGRDRKTTTEVQDSSQHQGFPPEAENCVKNTKNGQEMGNNQETETVQG